MSKLPGTEHREPNRKRKGEVKKYGGRNFKYCLAVSINRWCFFAYIFLQALVVCVHFAVSLALNTLLNCQFLEQGPGFVISVNALLPYTQLPL